MTEGRALVQVDQLLNSDLRSYRLPFLQRISQSGQLALTIWHGGPAKGIRSAPSNPQALPVPSRSVRNWFWPSGGERIVWQGGALGILRSGGTVIVCAEVIHNLTVWLIALAHGFFGKRLVLTGFFYRLGERSGLLSAVGDMARRFLHKRADAFLAYTERGREHLVASGVPADRVFVSHNTLDTERLRAMAKKVRQEDADQLRHEMGLEDDRVLLYLGRLIPDKRVDVAIDLLRSSRCSVSLLLVGDGILRDELERMALGLRVHFLGAVHDEFEVAKYFKLADLLVLPGRVGLNCVYGFANRVPCLTTSEFEVEQSPEYAYVKHDYNGLVVPSTDPEVYAQAVNTLLGDAPRMDRLQKGAAETAQRLKMGRMVEGFEQAVLKAARL